MSWLSGAVIDLVLAIFPAPHGQLLRYVLMVGGDSLNGVATGAYIGAGLGPGPRDGLMTGWAARGYSIRVVRTCIELTVLACGWALGGTVGIGTVLYAISIGPVAHVLVPRFTIARRGPRPSGARTYSDARLRSWTRFWAGERRPSGSVTS